MLKLFTLLLLSVITLAAKAQGPVSPYEIGISGGAAGYIGDLNQRKITKVSGPAFGAFVRKNFSPYVAAKLAYTHGWIQGADSTSSYQADRNRNLSFLTTLDEVSAVAEFNFFEFRPGIYHNAFTPYVFLGVGGVYYTPTAKYEGTRYDLRSGATEGVSYSKIAFTIPYGVGVKYNLNGKFSLAADAGYRSVNTDYLDDVSGNYVDPATIRSPIARELADRRSTANGKGTFGMQRGDGRSHDTYMFFTLSLSYTFLSDNCYFTK